MHVWVVPLWSLCVLHRGVRVDGEEIFLGDTRHVRGFSGKEDEHTCEVIKFYDQPGNDKEMVADVRWYYQPKELNSSKVKNMPDKFLPNEVIYSDDPSPVSVETITKKCFVAILDASKVPGKTSLNSDTLYCRWRLVKGEKHHLVPAILVNPKPTEDTQSTNDSTTNMMKTSHKRSAVMASKNSTKTSSERSTKKSSETTTKKKATVLKKVTEVTKALTKTSKVHQASSSLRKPKVRKSTAERSAEGTSFESARERYVDMW